MPQNSSHIEWLFQRFSNKEASEEEVRELFRLINQGGNDYELIKLFESEMETAAMAEPEDTKRRESVLMKIKEVIGILEAGDPAMPAKKSNFRWLGIAASVILVLAATVFYFRLDNNNNSVNDNKYAGDVAPGRVGATLTLASGQKILLSDEKNGQLAKEAGVVISKSANGQLVYELKDNGEVTGKINTLSTARGETYQLRLPDGSLVWLNAASSLTYAASLTERGKRMVRLSGEAYFEIAKDKAHPFIVQSGTQEVEVLGTHFNINSYQDEPLITTALIEGSVKVTSGGKGQMLKPGEQALNNGSSIKVEQANLENITDWKDGDFYLDKINFKVAMRKIARWYDVEVIYDQSVPDDIESGGWISRHNKLSAVLASIERTDQVHFKVEGKRVYVSK